MKEWNILGLDEAQEWGRIVRSFPQWDVYYLPEYTKAFFKNGDGSPYLITYDSGSLRAIHVVMKRSVQLGDTEYFDLVTPYGYGGFLLEGDRSACAMEHLKNGYEALCQEENVIAEFVRFHPVLDNAHQVEGLFQITDLGSTVKLDTTSPEIIWQNITSKNRNMIRKAKKSGMEVFWGRDVGLFDSFDEIYQATMDKVQAGSYYYFTKEFYQSILYDLKYQSLLFYAKIGNEIAAMSIVLFGSQQAHYHLSASRREYQHLAPTNLLLYEAALTACIMGKKSFHLGGGLGSSHDALYHFKKQFNREQDCVFSTGKKIYNQEVYDLLCIQNHSPKDTAYFPRYRA